MFDETHNLKTLIQFYKKNTDIIILFFYWRNYLVFLDMTVSIRLTQLIAFIIIKYKNHFRDIHGALHNQ